LPCSGCRAGDGRGAGRFATPWRPGRRHVEEQALPLGGSIISTADEMIRRSGPQLRYPRYLPHWLAFALAWAGDVQLQTLLPQSNRSPESGLPEFLFHDGFLLISSSWSLPKVHYAQVVRCGNRTTLLRDWTNTSAVDWGGDCLSEAGADRISHGRPDPSSSTSLLGDRTPDRLVNIGVVSASAPRFIPHHRMPSGLWGGAILSFGGSTFLRSVRHSDLRRAFRMQVVVLLWWVTQGAHLRHGSASRWLECQLAAMPPTADCITALLAPVRGATSP